MLKERTLFVGTALLFAMPGCPRPEAHSGRRVVPPPQGDGGIALWPSASPTSAPPELADASPELADASPEPADASPRSTVLRDPREVERWLKTRGADSAVLRRSRAWEECEAYAVPDALVCLNEAARPRASITSRIDGAIVMTANGVPRIAWHGPIAVSTGLEAEGPPMASDTYHTKLKVNLSPDGRALTIDENPEARCGHLSPLDAARRSSDAAYAQWVATAQRAVCASRGRYERKGDVFERVP